MTDLTPETLAAATHCDHYWSWVSPAGSSHSARLCMTCHMPDPAWLNEMADALAAEKAAREEAERTDLARRADKAEQELSICERVSQKNADAHMAEFAARKAAEARAVKAEAGWADAEKDVERLIAQVKQTEQERDQLTDQCDYWTNRAKTAEARVAELEAELAELKRRGCYPAVDYTASGGMVMDAEGRTLRTLTEKTDPTKEGE